MALAARLGPLSEPEGRQFARARVRLDASLAQAEDSEAIDVVVHDLSYHGFLAQTAATLPVGSEVWLELSGVGRVAARVRWRGSSTIGCEFATPIPAKQLDAALIKSRVVWPNFPANRTAQRIKPAVSSRVEPEAGSQPDVAEGESRWPFWRRAAFILGSSILLWSLIVLAIRTLWAVVA